MWEQELRHLFLCPAASCWLKGRPNRNTPPPPPPRRRPHVRNNHQRVAEEAGRVTAARIHHLLIANRVFFDLSPVLFLFFPLLPSFLPSRARVHVGVGRFSWGRSRPPASSIPQGEPLPATWPTSPSPLPFCTVSSSSQKLPQLNALSNQILALV